MAKKEKVEKAQGIHIKIENRIKSRMRPRISEILKSDRKADRGNNIE